MCGRFTLTLSYEDQLASLRLEEGYDSPSLSPRWNIAPGQMVTAVGTPKGEGRRRLISLRWGLVPAWAKDAKIGNRLINARRETVAKKPSFRSAFRKRRCLILADGFYEWQSVPHGPVFERKQPWYFSLADHGGFFFAGLWEHWHRPDGDLLYTCTILTTHANRLMAPVHDRMPVILDPEGEDAWLTARCDDPVLKRITEPYPDDLLEAYRVTEAVNDPARDGPECVAPKLMPGQRGNRVDPGQGEMF